MSVEEKRRQLIDKLQEFLFRTSCIHLDMGGDHRYALSLKSHRLLTELYCELNELRRMEREDE